MANTFVKSLVGLGAASAVAVSGAALASSQTGSSTQPSTGTTQQADGKGMGQHGMGMHKHTAVSGDELTSVKDAVKAKDSSVTVERVMKDADGSYDVMGTKAGKRVMVEVSKDLKTVEVRTGGPGMGGHGHGGPGGHDGHHQRPADLTGSALTSVKDAVKAKDASVTVEHAFKTPDGDYVALGKKGSTRVAYKVSSDFKTVTVDTRGPGHGPDGDHDGMGGPMGQQGQGGQQGHSGQSGSTQNQSGSTSSSTGSVTS